MALYAHLYEYEGEGVNVYIMCAISVLFYYFYTSSVRHCNSGYSIQPTGAMSGHHCHDYTLPEHQPAYQHLRKRIRIRNVPVQDAGVTATTVEAEGSGWEHSVILD